MTAYFVDPTVRSIPGDQSLCTAGSLSRTVDNILKIKEHNEIGVTLVDLHVRDYYGGSANFLGAGPRIDGSEIAQIFGTNRVEGGSTLTLPVTLAYCVEGDSFLKSIEMDITGIDDPE